MSLTAAVVGVGNMGRNHARVLSTMEGVELVGVVDEDAVRASDVARQVGSAAYVDLDDLPDVDFAVIAVPTIAHAACAGTLMNRGVSVLIEKPLASSPAEADQIVGLAERCGVLLATGHIERFNPVVSTLAEMVTKPVLMQLSRLSPYTPRISESVVFDLMVHDLDIACLLAGGAPSHVVAGGARVFSDTYDAASAVLTFPSGCVASVTASRITQDKVRRICVSEAERYYDADCLRQELSVKRETTGEYRSGSGYQQASVVEIPYLNRRAEALELQLRNFVDALTLGTAIEVDGRAGAASVALANQVERAIQARHDLAWGTRDAETARTP